MFEKFFIENGIIQLTSTCNNRCIICQDEFLYKNNGINKNLIELKKEIDILKKNGKKSISFYGAEPYMNKNMVPLLDYVNSTGMSCIIFSNGRIFANNLLVKHLRTIKQITVVTTLFSWKSEVHDAITDVSGSHVQTMAGIKNLVAANIAVAVTIVLTDKNVKQLSKTIKLLIDYGVKYVNVSGLIKQGAVLDRLELAPEFNDIKSSISLALNVVEKNNIKISFEKLPIDALPVEYRNRIRREKYHKDDLLFI